MVLFVSSTSRAQTKGAFYAELLGNGLIFSANYDMRLSDTDGGWGARIGVGICGRYDWGKC